MGPYGGVCRVKHILVANIGFCSGCTFMVTTAKVLGVGLRYSQGFRTISRVIESSFKDFWLLYEILSFGAEKKNQGIAYKNWVAFFWTIFFV